MHTEEHRTEEHHIEIVEGGVHGAHGVSDSHAGDESENEGLSSKIIKWIVVAGILIVLLIASIAIVKLVPKAISKISGAAVFLGQGGSDLAVGTNKSSVRSEDSFSVTWKGKEYENEVYRSVSFKCVSGITVEYKSTNGMKPVICDTVFPLPNTPEGSFPFVVTSLLSEKEELPFVISVTDKLENKVIVSNASSVDIFPKGSGNDAPPSDYTPDYSDPNPNTGTVTSTNSGTGSKDTTKTPPKTTTGGTGWGGNTSSGGYGTYYTGVETGNPDLRLVLTNVYVTDRQTGNNKSTSNIYSGDRITARFQVTNIGTRSSGLWVLNAQIPSSNAADRSYTSGYQPSLTPGSVYEMVIGFDSYDGNGDLVLTASNNNDANSSNNQLVVPLDGNGSSSGNNGRADLTARITGVGISNGNGSIYYTNNFDESDEIAVRFEIENIGGTQSGRFSFEAELPSRDDDTYSSPNYSSLAPGEKREFVLVVENPDSGSSRIRVKVDPDGDIRESNENNNTDSETIDIDN